MVYAAELLLLLLLLLQVMGKAVDTPGFPASESKRLSGLVGGKMSDDKRAAMQVRGAGVRRPAVRAGRLLGE